MQNHAKGCGTRKFKDENHRREGSATRHLLSVLHQLSGSTIDGATYTLDNSGNRTSKADQLAGVTSNYGYDPIYELTSVTQGANTTESYSYDSVGNRLNSLGLSPYGYNTSNELTSTPSASYTYDSNGNTTSKTDSTGTTNYAWDYENRLTSVTLPGSGGTVTFKYDVLGRRIQKVLVQNSTTTTTNYVYNGLDTAEETDQNGNVLAKNARTMNIDEPLAELRSGSTSFYEQDGLGTVTSMTTAAGALANTYTFDSFGKTTSSSGTLTNPFRYTGREFDTEASIYYYRARYYDPNIGRFLSEDKMGFKVAPDFYSYALNRPLDLVDPSGNYPGVLPWPWPAPISWPWTGLGTRILGGAAAAAGLISSVTVFAQSAGQSTDCQKGRDCAKEWEEAYEICRGLLTQPNPPRGLTGGYTDLENCARGFVSEECGGNPVDHGGSRR